MDIGGLIKQIRESKGQSLRDLSEKSGLSPSFLGQIERGETSPSMRSVKVLTEALGIRLTELFRTIEKEAGQSSHVVTLEQRRKIPNVFPPGIEMFFLAPENNGVLQPLMVFAEPGVSTGEGFFSHEGEEFAYVLLGSLWIKIDDAEYDMREGDCVSFKSKSIHRWENRGSATSVTLWVLTPRAW
jgi:transcriptional regulator with XRE-family HTH domain